VQKTHAGQSSPLGPRTIPGGHSGSVVTPSAEGSLEEDLDKSTGESSFRGGIGVGCFFGSGDTLGEGLNVVVGDFRVVVGFLVEKSFLRILSIPNESGFDGSCCFGGEGKGGRGRLKKGRKRNAGGYVGVGGGDDIGDDGETELENDVERGEDAENEEESGECAENDVFDEDEIGESHTLIIGEDVSLLLSICC